MAKLVKIFFLVKISMYTVLVLSLNNDSYLIDVNECEMNTDECEQICVDTLGSYECDCLSNFTLYSDGLRCIPGKIMELKWTCKVKVYLSAGPSFTLSLVNSPRVNGSTVSIDFADSTPVQSATCFLGKEFMKDCEFLDISIY